MSQELRRGVNEEREIKGMLEAVLTCKLKTGTIITLHQEDEIKKEGVTIKLVPVWKWLIEGKIA